MSDNTKQPQDHKPKRVDLPAFQFTHDGETYSLLNFGRIKAGIMRQIKGMSPGDAMFHVLEAVASKEVLAVLDDMEMSELNQVVADWQEDAKARLGEFSAS